MKHTSLYSAIGLAALLLALVAFNYLSSATPLRVDLTEGKLYTLSDGTRKVLGALPAPVKVKLYISRGDVVPVQMRSFAKRVEDLVAELKAVSGGKLIVERYDPKPDSDEADAAQLEGIEAQQLVTGDSFYLGISVSRLDRKHAIPVVTPQRERLLEYDLVRAIVRVARDSRPKIGLMAGMPVMGMPFNPMMRQPAEPWVLANELKRDFEVKTIPLSATEIDKDINVLLLIHPRSIEPQTEYAIDQFVLRGGKLIAFVDPYAFFDQQPTMPGAPGVGTSSNLPTLFKAWGVELLADKVVADANYASGAGQRLTPTVLSLNRTAFDRDDIVTSQVESLLYPFGGAFAIKPVEGIRAQPLVRSSPNAMLVDSANATKAGNEAMRSYLPGNVRHPLALRLSGRFKSAFPEGRPADKKAEASKPDAAAGTLAPHLERATQDNAMILVADVDLLADGAAVDVQEVFGQRVIVPSNGNLAFALSMLDQFSAGEELLTLRSRSSSFRPLTVVRELEIEAQKQYYGKVRALEDEIEKTTEKLETLQKARATTKGTQLLTPEQQAELERFRTRVAQTKKELKEVRRNLRQDSEQLAFLTKVLNIVLMPLLVTLFGLVLALLRRRRAQRALAA